MNSLDHRAQILIVEDEAIVSLDIRNTLTSAGFAVTHVASSGEDALRSMESSLPDLVLMDIHIQGKIDGVETAALIRERFQVPVIFVTAHADEQTLERAKSCQPFGYIVKPISKQSLTSTLEMALHKHEVERRLQEHRAWMATVLGGIPDGVIVTDIDGKVEFANAAAERLLGQKQSALVLRDVTSMVRLSSPSVTELTTLALEEAIETGRFELPRDTSLFVPASGGRIPIEGQVAISLVGQRIAGAIFTLRDASKREQQDLQIRQEQKMSALGEFAADLSESFFGLFDVIASANSKLKQLAAKDGRMVQEAESVQRASKMGKLMSGQLAKLGDPQSLRAQTVSVNEVISTTAPVFEKLKGPRLTMGFELCDEKTFVLCTASHLEQMLVNILVSGREFLAGGNGHLRLTTQIVKGQQERVQISVVLTAEAALPRDTELDLAVASAIATAAEGVLHFEREGENRAVVNILLPRQRTSIQAQTKFVETRGMVLIVGATAPVARQVEQQLETDRYVTIDCSTVAEALFVARFYDGEVVAVVADAEGVSVHNQQRLKKVFLNRNRKTKFVCLVTEMAQPPTTDLGWYAVSKASQMRDLANTLDALLATEDVTTRAAYH